MNFRQLGRAEVQVSEISFGCWTMGGLNWVNGVPNGWADPNEDDVVAGVKAGLEAGGPALGEAVRLVITMSAGPSWALTTSS